MGAEERERKLYILALTDLTPLAVREKRSRESCGRIYINELYFGLLTTGLSHDSEIYRMGTQSNFGQRLSENILQCLPVSHTAISIQ
jgi:hypothetical protein